MIGAAAAPLKPRDKKAEDIVGTERQWIVESWDFDNITTRQGLDSLPYFELFVM